MSARISAGRRHANCRSSCKEFAQGHIDKARLIPVQDIERRLHEIAAYKDRDTLVYCATGNRSTVASKILNDHRFERVSHLRHGIAK